MEAKNPGLIFIKSTDVTLEEIVDMVSGKTADMAPEEIAGVISREVENITPKGATDITE
ncbi:15775_t:CDS:1, partial [Gigaspora rosea]